MTTNSPNINDDGLIVFESSTGQFSGVELTTKGDVLTRTSSIYTRLGVGADGEALVCASGQTTGLDWDTVTSGSSVIFLESQTASNSSSIDFTASWDDATYAYYYFTYTNVRPSTDAVELRVRFSVNGGSSYITDDYRWVRARLSASSGSDSLNEDDSDSKIELTDSIGNNTGEGVAGKAIFMPSSNPGSVRAAPFMFDNVFVTGSGTVYRNFGAGMNETGSTINGLRFYMSSGNITNGVFKMYGVKNSL